MADKTDSSAGNIFERIKQVAREFSRELSKGKNPRIERFLSQVPEHAQETLFSNLIGLEANYRQRKGESPTSDEYVNRFPQYKREIRRAFFEPSMASVDSPSHTDVTESLGKSGQDSQELAVTFDIQEASQLGEYELLRKLGQGGMGIVYEARHTTTNNRVALKTLLNVGAGQQVNADKLYRFRKEFRRLSEINHPNLVGMQSLEVDGDHWFFTMDLIDGEDFLSYVRPDNQLDESRLRSCLKQLAAGVIELHRRGIIHRDLKPSNVLVSREGDLAILDFGLASQLHRSREMSMTKSGLFSGTPPYAAPEQMFGERTEASDWYAFGTMLFEALAGERPFQDKDPMALLRKKQEQDPPRLTTREELPGDLAALADGLLRREAPERSSAEEVFVKLGLHEDTRYGGSTRASTESEESSEAEEDLDEIATEDVELVGRESQLARLNTIRTQFAEEDKPAVIWVSGLSGEGKSSLIEKFLRPHRGENDELILSGRCYARESVPFKAIDSLIDALVSSLRRLSTEEVQALLPRDIDMLAQLFPAMRRITAVADRVPRNLDNIDDRQIRARAFVALRELLVEVAARKTITLFVDDLQWGDSDSAEVLLELFSPPDPPKILFIGSFRSDEAEASAFLNEWKKLQRQRNREFAEHEVRVEPLSEAQCIELLARRLSVEPDRLQSHGSELLAEAQGNPYFLEQLAENFDIETGKVQTLPLREVMQQRLLRLPSQAASLLEVIAVSGQALTLEEAVQAAGYDKKSYGTIAAMTSERLVRLIGSERDRLVDTYHDKIRETVLQTMSTEVRIGHHLVLARLIEAEETPLNVHELAETAKGNLPEHTPSRVFDLVFHFQHSGDRERTVAYAMLASRQARQQLAVESVLEYLEIAREMGEGLTPRAQFLIAKDRGEALILSGRYAEALGELNTAFKFADNDYDRAVIECFQGESIQRNGQFKESIVRLESALKRLGYEVPKSTTGLLFGLLREVIVQAGHTLFPQRLHRCPSEPQAELTVRSLNWLSQQYIFENTLKMLHSQLAALNRAERLPFSRDTTPSTVWHGGFIAMVGWKSRANKFLGRGREYCRASNDNWINGFADASSGIGYYATANYHKSMASVEAAMNTFGDAGDQYLVNLLLFHRGACHYMLGDLASSIADARRAYNLSVQIGDSRSMCASWLWARATDGQLPFETLRKNIPVRPDDVMSTTHAKLAEGLWHSRHGRTEEALEVIDSATSKVRNAICINAHTTLVFPYLAKALRERASVLHSGNLAEGNRLRKRALRVAKWGARASRFFPSTRVVAFRELAAIQCDLGHLRKAWKNTNKSCQVAKQQSAPYEAAKSEMLRWQIATQLEMPDAASSLEKARAELERFYAMMEEGIAAPNHQGESVP